ERLDAGGSGDIDHQTVAAGAEDHGAGGPVEAVRVEKPVVDFIARELLGRLQLEVGEKTGVLPLESLEKAEIDDVPTIEKEVVISFAIAGARGVAKRLSAAKSHQCAGLCSSNSRKLFKYIRPIFGDRGGFIDAIK